MNSSLNLFFVLVAALTTQLSHAEERDSKKPKQERKDSREDRRDSRREQRQVERKDSRDNRDQQRPSSGQQTIQKRSDPVSREKDNQQRPPTERHPSNFQPLDQKRPEGGSKNRKDWGHSDRDRPDVVSRESRDSKNDRDDRKSMENRGNYERKLRNEKSRPAYSRDEEKKKSEEWRSGFYKRKEFGKKTSANAEVRLKRYHPSYRNWFNPIFFQRHNYYPKYWKGNVNWWRGAQWNQINYWLGWANTVYPIYYDVGGYPIQIDRNWQEYATSANAQDFAQFRGEEWLPLGVFALGQNAESAVNSDVFIQLAVDRRGNLSGIYFNASSDKSYLLEGYIEPTKQQVYWRIAQENFVLEMETGIYNLTQDFANIQLTFLGGIVQNWVLVRVID